MFSKSELRQRKERHLKTSFEKNTVIEDSHMIEKKLIKRYFEICNSLKKLLHSISDVVGEQKSGSNRVHDLLFGFGSGWGIIISGMFPSDFCV